MKVSPLMVSLLALHRNNKVKVSASMTRFSAITLYEEYMTSTWLPWFEFLLGSLISRHFRYADLRSSGIKARNFMLCTVLFVYGFGSL